MRTIKLLLVPAAFLLIYGCGNQNSIKKIEASGNIEATNVVVSAKVGGQIEKLNFIEGDRVKKGDTLLVIDSETQRIQLQESVASKELAEARLQLLKNGARKEDLERSKAELKQADINLDQAERDKKRMDRLFAAKTVSQKQHEDAVDRYNLMQQQFKSAQENYDKLKNFARPEEIKQAIAKVRQAEASVDLIKKQIRDSYVISPINGFIVKKYFEAGETISPLASLLTISDLSVVKLKIYVSEEELGKVKLGQKAEITTDSYKNKTYEGKVIYISPEAEFTPKNIQTKDERTRLVFAVKIEIKNPGFELKAGMPADAVIQL